MSQEEQSMSGGLRTEVSRPLQQIVIRPRFRRRYFPGMGNRHSDTSFDRPTRIYLLDGQQDEIPMADDCPSPNPLLGPGLLTLPLRRGAKYAAETALENSPLSSSYYSEEEGDGGGKREGARRALPRRPRITMQRSAAARLCRRGSPPFAQTELLSESEISDLEEQIASGRLVNGASEEGTLRQFLEDGGSREREQEHKDGGETGDGRSVEGDGEGRKQDPPEEAEGTLGKSASICGSCSMPTIHCAPAGGGGYWGSGHAPANFWQSEYPAENEPWEEHLSGANMHRSLTMQGEMEGQLRGGRRRRMLPLRPDQQPRTSAQEAPGAAEQSSECLSPPSEPLLSQSFSAKRRQLPKIPSGEGPLDSIDIASTTKEYLLSVLHRGGGPQQQRRRESGSQMDEQPLEVEEDFSPSGPVLPSPSVVQRPALALAAAFVGPRWGNAAQHQSSSEEYKFSYGLDQSVLRHARKGLSMEDSYYEDVDGLNGNLVGLYDGGARERARGWNREDELYTPDDETERRKVSAYNLADGAKSSSGISSCCTTSSRSCEPAEGHSYQQLLVRRQRQRADALANDPSAPTHRAQFPFMPRHADEMALERGDALHVGEKYEDHWCFGTNLRTGQRGIFPEAHIVEIDLVEEICRSVLPDSVPHQAKQERDTFYLTMLASIEVAHHKGNDVLVQAINKVCSVYQQKEEILVPQTVLMEISFRGIHVIDKRKKDIFRCPTFDYFYSLQNIAFCGAHPKELRYFGFITKHPLLPRFACHVFLSNESTQPIVEAIGRAFKRSYDEYMAFAHPTEDIFID